VIEGTLEDEQWLHRYLKEEIGASVVCGKREWYEPCAVLLSYIDSDAALYPVPVRLSLED